MECNREVLRITTGGGVPERMAFSVKKKSLSESWAAQHPRYESQGPIAAGFSHRALPVGFSPCASWISRRFHCRCVPLPVRRPFERTVFRERLLNL